MKPKREITLGEMQDECKRVFGGCALCRVKNECAFCLDVQPAEVDLTDPPRFTEAQMAFLKGCYAIGIVGLLRNGDKVRLHFLTVHGTIGFLNDMGLMIPIEKNETLDLAELFGKEGS